MRAIISSQRKLIPAICHLDSTSRVQTVNAIDNPKIYEVISEFAKQTGVPIICNTSLIDNGEPIIQTVEDALNFSLRKGIDVLYINGWRIELVKHSEYGEAAPLTRPYLKWFQVPDDGALPPLNRRETMIYFHNPRLQRFQLDDAVSLKKLKRRVGKIDELYSHRADFRFIDIWHT